MSKQVIEVGDEVTSVFKARPGTGKVLALEGVHAYVEWYPSGVRELCLEVNLTKAGVHQFVERDPTFTAEEVEWYTRYGWVNLENVSVHQIKSVLLNRRSEERAKVERRKICNAIAATELELRALKNRLNKLDNMS